MSAALNRKPFRREWKSIVFFLILVTLPTLWVALGPKTELQAVSGTILATTLVGLIGWWFLRREGVRAADVGFGRESWIPSILLFLAWWVAVSLIDFAAPYIARLFGAQLQTLAPAPLTLSTFLELIKSWLFVGFAEEIAWRGYLQNKLAGLVDKRWVALAQAAFLFSLWHVPAAIIQNGGLSSGLLFNVLVIAILSLLLFNLPYEWTGLLPFIALVHGWNDDLLMINLQAPNVVGLVAGYLLVFVFLWLYAKFWRKPALRSSEIPSGLK